MVTTIQNTVTRAAAILTTAVALVGAAGLSADANAQGSVALQFGDTLTAQGNQRVAGNDRAQLVLHHNGMLALHANDDGRLLWNTHSPGTNAVLALGHNGLELRGPNGGYAWSAPGTDLRMAGCGFELTDSAGNPYFSVHRDCAATPATVSARPFDGTCIAVDRWSRVARGSRARMLTTPWGEVGIWTNDASNRKVWSAEGFGAGSHLCFWKNGALVLYSADWAQSHELNSHHSAASYLEMEGCGASFRLATGPRSHSLGNTTCDIETSFAGGHSKSDSFGGDDFKAGYSFGVGVDQAAGVQDLGSITRAYAYGNTYVRVFGNEKTILGANAEAVSTREDSEATATLTVMGYDMQRDLGLEDKQIVKISKTFFSKSKTIIVGIFPIVVKASATGEIGMTGHARPGAAGFNVGVRPYANLTGSASAGIGAICASAGIRGQLTLIEVGVPTSANLMVDMNNAVTVHLSSEIEIESLSGTLSLYYDLCGLGDELELTSWDGLEATVPVFNQTLHL